MNVDLHILRNGYVLNKMQTNVNKKKYVNFSFKNFDIVFDPKYIIFQARKRQIVINCEITQFQVIS